MNQGNRTNPDPIIRGGQGGVRGHGAFYYPRHFVSLFIAHQRNAAAEGHRRIQTYRLVSQSSRAITGAAPKGSVPLIQTNATTARS